MVYDKASEGVLLLGDHADLESSDRLSLDAVDHDVYRPSSHLQPPSNTPWLRSFSRSRSPFPKLRGVSPFKSSKHSKRYRSWPTRLILFFAYFVFAFGTVFILCFTFFPSYCNPPERYVALRTIATESTIPGRANPRGEKVYIAATIYDEGGRLLSGPFGCAIHQLIDLLGPQNVFLSVYENDPDEQSQLALDTFRRNTTCANSIVSEHLDLSTFQPMTALDGTRHLKRIDVLANLRNRALRPLDNPSSPAYHTRWDKLLYLNDIVFDPVDAANLLFNTNADESTGKANYRAACAVDFIKPEKFYDTYATRDYDGYGVGIPHYPWFTGAGSGTSRRDVLSQKDAVRVKSCWGGMVAFEAKWFQPNAYQNTNSSDSVDTNLNLNRDTHRPDRNASLPSTYSPLRFRSEPDPFWDASECCLIHGDLAYISHSPDDDLGIYMNPYIRVAYSPTVLFWLPFMRRFEWLWMPTQVIISRIVGVPKHNPRREERAGEVHVDRVWEWDEDFLAAVDNGTVEVMEGTGLLHGAYRDVERVAQPGMFCGMRKLSILKDSRDKGKSFLPAKIPPDRERSPGA